MKKRNVRFRQREAWMRRGMKSDPYQVLPPSLERHELKKRDTLP